MNTLLEEVSFLRFLLGLARVSSNTSNLRSVNALQQEEEYAHNTDQNLTAENYGHHRIFLKKKKSSDTHASTASQPVFARSTVTVSSFEKRERTYMLMVQDPRFTLKSTVTTQKRFSANVVLNRMELLCHA